MSEFKPLDGIEFREDGFNHFLPEYGLFFLYIHYYPRPDRVIGYFPSISPHAILPVQGVFIPNIHKAFYIEKILVIYNRFVV